MSTVRPVHEDEINAVLERSVDEEGLVDYHSEELEAAVRLYAKLIATTRIEAMKDRDRELAFWINAYNMLVILGVIETIRTNPKWVVKGNKGVGSKLRFFMSTKYEIAGNRYSLYQLENDVIRKGFKKPGIHFALVCAALSCPKLRRNLYTAEGLHEQVQDDAREFINSPRGSVLDKGRMEITLSKIFRMYKKDFGSGIGDILDFVSRFHKEGDFIRANKDALKVRFMHYDWTPNIKT